MGGKTLEWPAIFAENYVQNDGAFGECSREIRTQRLLVWVCFSFVCLLPDQLLPPSLAKRCDGGFFSEEFCLERLSIPTESTTA